MTYYRQPASGRVLATGRDPDTILLSLGPSFWWRPTHFTLSGSNVVALQNLVGTDALTIAVGTMGAPSANALYGQQDVLTFNGTQQFLSTLSPASFAFLNAGTGSSIVHIATPTNLAAGSRISLSTAATVISGVQRGFTMFTATADSRVFIGNGAPGGTVYFSALGVTLTTTRAFYRESYFAASGSPLHSYYVNGVLRASQVGNTNAPSAGDPAGTSFCLGGLANSPGGAAEELWAETILFTRALSAADRVTLAKYIFYRYRTIGAS